jgi:hypothetical protein
MSWGRLIRWTVATRGHAAIAAISAVACVVLLGALAPGAAEASTFSAVAGQSIGPTVMVGTFNEACIDAMACTELAPNVNMITWGDATGATSTPSCDIDTDTPGSDCWITGSCDPPVGCTFSVFAPGHVYSEPGTYTVTGNWTDSDTHAINNFSSTADVADAPLGSDTGGSISVLTGQPISHFTIATFTYGNPGDHSAEMAATIDWGDGSAATSCGPASSGDPCVIAFASGVYSVIASHTYARAGSYAPTVLITHLGGSQTQTDARVTVITPLGLAVTGISTSGPTVAVAIACQGSPGQSCAGSLALTSTEHTHGRSVVAVTAAKRQPVKTVSRTVSLGQRSFDLPVGGGTTLTLELNPAGRKLLSEFYALPVKLSITGAGASTRRVTFRYPRIASLITYTVTFHSASSSVQALNVAGLPHPARVVVSCRGAGCPFSRRTSQPRGKEANLASLFSGAELSPGTTFQIEVTAPDRVGKVLRVRINSGAAPTQSSLCLPPGATSPRACR